jgi:hypothetical protein
VADLLREYFKPEQGVFASMKAIKVRVRKLAEAAVNPGRL